MEMCCIGSDDLEEIWETKCQTRQAFDLIQKGSSDILKNFGMEDLAPVHAVESTDTQIYVLLNINLGEY